MRPQSAMSKRRPAGVFNESSLSYAASLKGPTAATLTPGFSRVRLELRQSCQRGGGQVHLAAKYGQVPVKQDRTGRSLALRVILRPAHTLQELIGDVPEEEPEALLAPCKSSHVAASFFKS